MMIFETQMSFKGDEFDNVMGDPDYSYYGNYSSAGDGEVCESTSSIDFDASFKPILYSLALVMGLLGNGLVLVVLWRKRKGLNVTDIFILHLSLADILLLLTLPLWAVEAVKGWIFHTPLCKLTGALFKIISTAVEKVISWGTVVAGTQILYGFRDIPLKKHYIHVNFYCGIYMLSCISLDRYLSIVHAVQMYSRKKPMVIHCCCLMVWIFCFLLSIPEWILLGANMDIRRDNRTECVPAHFSNFWHLFNRALYHILGFALPAVMMLVCYSSILSQLRRGSQCMQKKRAIRVIVALVVAFFISWTPYNISLIFDTVHGINTQSLDNQTYCDTGTTLDMALTVTSTIAYLHCCVNPVLYAFVGVKFRQSLLEMLKPLGFRLKGRAGLVSKRSSVWLESGDTSQTSAF